MKKKKTLEKSKLDGRKFEYEPKRRNTETQYESNCVNYSSPAIIYDTIILCFAFKEVFIVAGE